MPTEANQSTDDTSLEDGLETNITLISSTEQIDEKSITKDEGDKMQEEIIVAETLKEETEGESTEKKIEEVKPLPYPNKNKNKKRICHLDDLKTGTVPVPISTCHLVLHQ